MCGGQLERLTAGAAGTALPSGPNLNSKGLQGDEGLEGRLLPL